jgi:2,3-bisphosphoglycerate-dependent phosphoglycerate mutase
MHQFAFLRHGRSRADDEERFESRYDSPLTEIGKQQAHRLAEKWYDDSNRHYECIISSPSCCAARLSL